MSFLATLSISTNDGDSRPVCHGCGGCDVVDFLDSELLGGCAFSEVRAGDGNTISPNDFSAKTLTRLNRIMPQAIFLLTYSVFDRIFQTTSNKISGVHGKMAIRTSLSSKFSSKSCNSAFTMH